jgi:ribosomal protein S12 methylthiotransferase accessory factor
MIIDGIPYTKVYEDAPRGKGAIIAFLDFIERKLGLTILKDKRLCPMGKADLATYFVLAKKLKEAGILDSYYLTPHYPDEPRMEMWACILNTKDKRVASGATLTDEKSALMAALAETQERFIWKEENDYFRKPILGSVAQLRAKHISHLPPEDFVSFSKEQRATLPELFFDEHTEFAWTLAHSLVQKKDVYVPTQTISGCTDYNLNGATSFSPLIRNRTTIGLASWPTKTGARLAGALEVIEREAYMMMWLNQLSLPRIDLNLLAQNNASLQKLLATLERYKLKMHCVSLITDAPTYALCTVLEDISGSAPRFTLGLKAHRSLFVAIEKSLVEAMRARRHTRRKSYVSSEEESPEEIGHYDRLTYWAEPLKAPELEFLTKGDLVQHVVNVWEKDSEETHLQRILSWCANNRIEFLSVPLTHSKRNVLGLHIEMIVLPQLQPTHLSEKDIALGGERWREIPAKFGYKPRKKMFTSKPHPFA